MMMRKKSWLTIIPLIAGFVFLALLKPNQVLATCPPGCRAGNCFGACGACEWCPEIQNPALSETIRNWTGISFISNFLPNLITLFFIIGAVVALIVLLAGGVRWVTSGADKEATAKAQGTITSAVIGLVLIFSIYAVLRLIEYIFNISLITIDIEPLILK